MASFTDVQPRQYTPYIQQNPVEAMSQVGMQREQDLHQGIQRVNDYFEKIGGLDMLRSQDKEYTQNQLSSLKDGITNDLSGDFSDQRIVNQIGSAASQIYKDPIVQNAYTSTQAVRTGQNDMVEARKKGESGPSNEYVFNKAINDYVTDKRQDASFGTKYEKYTPVTKNVTEILKSLTGNKDIKDDSYEIDANGKITGIKDVNIKSSFAGISPQKIKDALNVGLSPQDWRQMQMDGQYKYANMTPEQFSKGVQDTYAGKANDIKKQISIIDNSKPASPSAAADNAAKRANLVSYLNSTKGEYDAITSTLGSGDVESAKAKLHTNDTLNQFASAFSYSEVSQEYTKNIAKEQENFNRTYDRQIKEWNADYQLKSEEFSMKKEEFQMKKDKQAKEDAADLGGLTLPVDQKSVVDPTKESVANMVVTKQKQIDSQISNFIKQAGKDPNSQEGKDYYNTRMAILNKEANGILDGGETEKLLAIANQQREANNTKKMVGDVVTEFNNDPKYKKIQDLIPKDAKNIIYTERDANGNQKQYSFSPLELTKGGALAEKYNSIIQNRSQNTSIEQATAQANATFGPKELKLINILKDHYSSEDFVPGSTIKHSDANNTIANYVNHYNNIVNTAYSKSESEKNDAINKEIQNRLQLNQSTSHAYTMAKKEDQDVAARIMATSIANAKAYGGTDKLGNKLEDLQNLSVADLKTLVYTKRNASDFNEPLNRVTVTGDVKGKAVSMDMEFTPEQSQNLFGEKYSRDKYTQAFQPIENQMMLTPNKNTTDNGTPFFTSHNFPRTSAYAVTGNVEKSPSGGYMLKVNVKDPVTGKETPITYPQSGLMTKQTLLEVKDNMTDASIFQLLNPEHKAPTDEEMKQLINAKAKQIHY